MFFHVQAIAARYSVSTTSVWRWVREGYFPPPQYLRPKCPRWSEQTVLAWEAKISQPENPAATSTAAVPVTEEVA